MRQGGELATSVRGARKAVLDRGRCGDDDDDGVPDVEDVCPLIGNVEQVDTDGDGRGDPCDNDDDDDGVLDEQDNCVLVANPQQQDTDGDAQGDRCDVDDDGDGVPDEEDNCPQLRNPDQRDTDATLPGRGDRDGDACDLDDDDDLVPDGADNCPLVPNARQRDVDTDGLGDVCDPDMDGDGVLNATAPSKSASPAKISFDDALLTRFDRGVSLGSPPSLCLRSSAW